MTNSAHYVDAHAYSALRPVARAALSRSDPKAYRKLRKAHQARLAELEKQFHAAKTLADRQRIASEAAKLMSVDLGSDGGPNEAA